MVLAILQSIDSAPATEATSPVRKTWIVALVIALLPAWASAVSMSEIRHKLEYSLLVKGEIETRAQGEVSSVNVDKRDKFPPGLVDYVKQQVSGWKFEPALVAGKPAHTRRSMSLVVVARKFPDKGVAIGIRDASFGPQQLKEDGFIYALSQKQPVYPSSMRAKGVAGTVYVLVRVGRDGKVQDAVVERVNLRVLAKEHVMESWRAALSGAALEAVKEWTFIVPTKGPYGDAPFWPAWAPVNFEIKNAKGAVINAPANAVQEGYGKWKTYVRGPRQSISWLLENRPGFSSDSLEEGGVYVAENDTGPKRLAPLYVI